jgi:hypothetical protein
LLDHEEQLVAYRREIEEAHRREINMENRHETLRRVALGAVVALNARGVSLKDHLQDIPVRFREVATHRVGYGARVTLAATQLRSGHEIRQED